MADATMVPCPTCEGNEPRCSRARCRRDRWCECDLPVCPECDGSGVVPDEDIEAAVAAKEAA